MSARNPINQSQILVVDDDSQLREAIVDTLMLTGYGCIEASSGEQALDLLLRRHVDMVIADIQMDGMDGHKLLRSIHNKYPQIPVLLMTAYANIDGAVRAMRDGAIDYLSKPFSPEVLLNQVSRYVPVKRIPKREPIWADPSTGELLQLALKVSATDATVMITGPSGSGKEVLSRYVHDNSPRANGPFVAINCAAIPDTMLESTLFGYEKGAFTGAVQACPGKFEQAQGGTILLDEITEMDLGLQAKLLRVLQEREVERLGGRKTIALDVRVIATSNRDLKQAVSEHKFREDLYYRLNVFPLRWKPLYQRKEDILPLARFFLQRHASENGGPIPELSEEATKRLEEYSWPGNVRELENVMQRAIILSDGNTVQVKDLILDNEPLANSNLPEEEGISPELRQELQTVKSKEGTSGASTVADAPSPESAAADAGFDAAATTGVAGESVGFAEAGVGAGAESVEAAVPSEMGVPPELGAAEAVAGAGATAGAAGAMAGNVAAMGMANPAMNPASMGLNPAAAAAAAAAAQAARAAQMGQMGQIAPNNPLSFPGNSFVTPMSPSDFAQFMGMGMGGSNMQAAAARAAAAQAAQAAAVAAAAAAAMSSQNQLPGVSPVGAVNPMGNAAGALGMAKPKVPTSLGGELKQQEFQIILDTLIECHGRRQAVSKKLGISPRTLRYKIAKMRAEGIIIPS